MHPVDVLLLIGAVATALFAIYTLTRTVYNAIHSRWVLFTDVLESYTGRPGNHYREAEPSVPERMKNNEQLLHRIVEQSEINEQRLYKIEKMVYPNGGGSLLDLVQDLTKEVKRITRDHENMHKETPQ